MDPGHARGAERFSISAAGLSVAAWAWGAEGERVVFVHGFPDTSSVWAPVVDRLCDTHRCITYDVRGAGESDRPDGREGYLLARLVDDFVAVVDALSPGRPVHVVAHDWGSVAMWEAVCRERSDPRLTGRIASFTSISGPCLAHVGAFYRAARRASWRTAEGRSRKREAIAQVGRSWYVAAFRVPGVSDAIVRRTSRRLLDRGRGHFAPTLASDAVDGLNLYRANVGHYEPIPGGPRTDVPVLLIVPLRDRYVSPAMASQAAAYVPRLRRVDVDAGHWVMQTHPDAVADLVAGQVRAYAVGGSSDR